MTDAPGRTSAAAAGLYLEFAARGRNAWWRYLVALPLALVLATVLGVVIGFGLSLSGIPMTALVGELSKPTHPPVFMLGVAFNFGVVLAGLFIAAWLIQRKSPLDLIGRWSWSKVGLGAVAWLVMNAIMTLVDVAAAPKGFSWTAASGTLLLGGCATLALAVQTFTEEVLFRGYITQAMLLATRRPVPAAILSGLIFGAVHISNGLPQAVSATGFGIAASLITIRLGGLAFTFGLHWINNLYGAAVVVESNDVFHGFPGLVTQATPGLTWFDVATTFVALAIVYAIVLRVSPSSKTTNPTTLTNAPLGSSPLS